MNLPFLLIAAQLPIPMPIAQAAARKALIAGRIGPVRKQVRGGLGYVVGRPESEGMYRLQFVTSAGSYDVDVPASGAKVIRITRTYPGPRSSTLVRRLPSPGETQTAIRIAKDLGLNGPLGAAPWGFALADRTRLQVAQLVDGHRVFCGPYAVGALMSIDAKGRLVDFERHDGMPSVIRSKTILPASQAIRLYQASFRGKLRRFRPFRDPELIYYRSGSGPARLAWYVPAEVAVETGYAIRGGDSTVLADASTGQPVPISIQFSDGPLR